MLPRDGVTHSRRTKLERFKRMSDARGVRARPGRKRSRVDSAVPREPDSDQKRDTCAGAWNYLAFSLRTPLKGFAEALFF